MRFLKIFLATLGMVAGVIGASLGVMALQGRFDQERIGPGSIHFSGDAFMVDSDFELTISPFNQEVTEKQVTLSFSAASQVVEQDGTISDGTIIVPKVVRIGVPFEVKLAKHIISFGGEDFEWIRGGVSTLRATSEDKLATPDTTQVFVDVPVHSLTVETSALEEGQNQQAFDVNSSFFAKASFFPQASAFKYSQNGQNGRALEYKSVFFNSLDTQFVEMTGLDANSFGKHRASFNAKEEKENVLISAFAFATAKQEENVLAEVAGISSVNERYDEVLSRFQRQDVLSVEKNVHVNVSPLVVGEFTTTTLEIRTKFNQPVVVMVNQPTGQNTTHFNLAAKVMTSDGKVELTSHYANIGLGFLVDRNGALEPATSQDFYVQGGKQIVSSINGKDVTFFLPNINAVSLGASGWEITALKEGLTSQAVVVLFNSDLPNAEINPSSFEGGNIKNMIDVVAQGKVSDYRIYWNNAFDYTKTLYIEKSEDGDFYSNYNFANPGIDNATAFVDQRNTYRSVRYFAYLAFNEQVVGQDGLKVYDFIKASTTPTLFHTGTETLYLYEILDGNLIADQVELPEGYVLKVVFATIVTDNNEKPVIENDSYVIDLISRDSDRKIQTLSFDIKQALKTIKANAMMGTIDVAFDNDTKTVAVRHKTQQAFRIEFDVFEEHKEIFVKDFNAGKIELRFLINGQAAQSFVYLQPVFEVEDQSFSVWVEIREVDFSNLGYDLFEIEIAYTKGDIVSGQQDTYKVTKAFFEVEGEEFVFENAKFEVYDGLIATLEFGGELADVSPNSPIEVRTSLHVGSRDPITHIIYPSQASTSSLTHADILNVAEELYLENTNTVNIVALDKYGKVVEFELNKWRLVSSNTDFISVGVDGQTLSFDKTTPQNEPIGVKIETANMAVGGVGLVSSQELFFVVETRGNLVDVSKKSVDQSEYTTVWKNTGFDIDDHRNGAFRIDNLNENFNQETKIGVDIVGSAGKLVPLTRIDQSNILKVLYALPNEQEGPNYYDVFDLVPITSFFIVGNAALFDGFINFSFNEQTGGVESFNILKNFGREAEINFSAQTSIGISFSVVVNISRFIEGTIQENYSHAGATPITENGLNYHGVFAEHKIEIDIINFTISNFIAAGYKPLVYDFNTKRVIALYDEQTLVNSITATANSVKIVLYLPDVEGNILRNLVFVLDSSGQNISLNNYERSIFDFAIETLRFRVNPNIKVEAGQRENVSFENNIITIRAKDSQIENFVSTTDIAQGVIFASEIKERRVDLKTYSDQVVFPYVDAYLVDSTGTQKITNHDFVALANNVLTIKNFNNSVTFYVAVEHKISLTASQKIVYYTVRIVPSIFENNENGNFVTYDGTRYLQLVTRNGQDSSQDEGLGTETSVVYTFDTLRTMFTDGTNSNRMTVRFVQASLAGWFKVENTYIRLDTKSEARVGVLNIIVTLDGFASAEFPVILLPLKAPFVVYDNQTPYQDDSDLFERNDLANQDIIYSIGKIGISGPEKYAKLYTENIYDVVNDSLKDINLFVNPNSIIKNGIDFEGYYAEGAAPNPIGFTYLLANDPTSLVPAAQVASINSSNGLLETFKIGQDTFIIVVVRYSNQFELYYRLKVKASSEMKVFYPYEAVNAQGDKAEYLFLNGQNTVYIDFNSNFDLSIPATKQAIDNVFIADESVAGGYRAVETFPTSRFGLFRKLELGGGQDAFEKLVLNLKSVKIARITTQPGGVVSPALWNTYVTQDQQNLFRFVFKYSTMKYTVVFDVENDLFAKTTYTVVVEATSPTYQVVDATTGSGSISNMIPVAQNFVFNLGSPDVQGETISDILNTMKLRQNNISGAIDITNELKYHIFEDYSKVLSINQDKQIVASYTPNTVRAKIMFYTKFGTVAIYDIVVESKIFVAEIGGNAEKLSHTMYAGEKFDLSSLVRFAERPQEGQSITEVIASSGWQISFKGLPAGQTMPNFVRPVANEPDAFYILPISQNSVTLTLGVVVVLDDGQDSQFEFEFVLTINKNISSKHANSSVPGTLSNHVYGGEDFEIALFGNFFEGHSNFAVAMQNTEIVATNQTETYFSYDVEIVATNSAGLVSVKSVADGRINFATNPVASQTTIILKAIITYVSVDQSYILGNESFFAVTLTPDSNVEVFYPYVNGTEHTSEKIVYTADQNINLSRNNMFRPEAEPRVKITLLPSGDVAQAEDFEEGEVFVKYRVIAGERERLRFNGNVVNTDNTSYNFFTTNFTFTFDSGGLSYSEVAFDVYVKGIVRTTYKIDIYKDITSVYGIKLNNINPVEENNREVFYLGESKKEIFAGVQAIKFLVDANFRKNLTLEVYKNQVGGTNKNLNMSINLAPHDANFVKTILPRVGNNATDVVDLLDLTASNIRFRIVENGNQSEFKTLNGLVTEGIVALAPTGGANAQLIRRLEVTYLGQEITDAKFLEKLTLVEDTPMGYSDFAIKETGLGGNTLFRNGQVSIFFGNNAETNNNLGIYNYKLRVNLAVAVTQYEMNVGEEIGKTLDTFGINKLTGEKFVTYNGNNPQSYADIITSEAVELNFYFKRVDNDPNKEVEYKDAVTGNPYSYIGNLAPITISERNIIGTTIKYDFRILANGANNNGVVVTGVFRYTYKDPNGNSENDIVFETEIEITIKSVWDIYTTNRYTTGANSMQNPEVVSAQQFAEGSNVMTYVLIDNRTSAIEKGIVVRKAGSSFDTKNYAIDFQKTDIELEGSYASMGDPIRNQSNIVVAKQINIFKPSFAERMFTVAIEDNYGYRVTFYFKVLPTTEITYDSGLHNSTNRIFEGDSFMIKSGADETGKDHIVRLSEQSSLNNSSYTAKFTLHNNSSRVLLANLTDITQNDGFVAITKANHFAFLDSELFVKSLNNVLVFMKIEIKKDLGGGASETYTIDTQAFYLYQRYVTSVGLNKVSDGRTFNLVDHIEIEDKKFNAPLGTPKLINDQTLVIADSEFYGEIKVLGFNSSNNKLTETIEVKALTAQEIAANKVRYISLETYFGTKIANILTYSFRVVEVVDKNQKIKIAYADETTLQVLSDEGMALADDDYLIRMGDANEVRDILVKAGQDVTVTATGNGKLGIIGYEIFDITKTFTLELVENQDNKQEDLLINLPTDPAHIVSDYQIALRNFGTSSSGIVSLLITRSSETLYRIVSTSTNGQQVVYDNLALADFEDEFEQIHKSIKLKFTYGGSLKSFIDSGEDWAISGYQYKIGANFVDNNKFVIVQDKKLTIATVENIKTPGENPVYETVNVYFDGVNRYIEVTLNKNEKQEFSILETAIAGGNGWGSSTTIKNFNPNSVQLRYPSAISSSHLSKIKGVSYFNDTIQFKMGAVQGSGVINFRLVKENSSGNVFYKDFGIETSTYAKTFTLGISQAFKDTDGKITAVGDKYSLELLSLPDISVFGSFKVIWPNGQEYSVALTLGVIFEDLDFGVYEVSAFDNDSNALIEEGNVKIDLDSKELYARYNDTKEVPYYNYYLISFNGAVHYVDPVEYKVSPYYFGVDTSYVYEGTTQLRVISDYSQYQPQNPDNVAYIVQADTWTGGIPFVDAYLNMISGDGGVLYLSNELKKSNPIVKVSLDSEGASGSGRLENNNLIIELAKESSIENIYFVVDVLVALNGKLAEIPAETQWLKIGEIRVAFDSHKQYFLEPKDENDQNIGYIISTVKDQETFVKYIEIDSDQPTTFSVSKLFQDDTLTLANVTTVNAEGKGLENVYLEDANAGTKYQVSYLINQGTTNQIEVHTVLESKSTGMPIVIGNNIVKGETIEFNLTVDGVEHTGSYRHNPVMDKVLFGKISLNNILTSQDGSGQSFASLIGSSTNYNLTSTNNKVKVFWTQVDLTEIATNFALRYFGDAITPKVGADEIISQIIHSSPMFKITKLDGTESEVTEVKVNVAPRELVQPTVEYYAVSQIEFDANKVATKAQTIVYKVTNELITQKTETIKLYGMLQSAGAFTNIVLVEKLNNITGITGVALFNTGTEQNPELYEYKIGTLDIAEDADLEDATVENHITVFKKGEGEGIKKDNLSHTFKVDFLKLTSEYEEDEVLYSQHAIIQVKKLELVENKTDEFTINFAPAASQNYNMITTGERNIYGNNERLYTYEYVSTARQTLKFNLEENDVLGETVFIIKANAGTLAWHEFEGRYSTLPNGKLYYNLFDASANDGDGELTTVVAESFAQMQITNLADGDIISEMWDGTIYYAQADSVMYAKATYTTADDDEIEMLFIVADYLIGETKYVDLATLFENFDNGKINKLKFGSGIQIHTSLTELGLTVQEQTYKFKYKDEADQDKTYALLKVASAQDLNYSIFDLIKAKSSDDKISRIVRSNVTYSVFAQTMSVASAGSYSFYQTETSKFVVKHFEATELRYNLFEIFETNLIAVSDGNIEITELKTQIVVETTATEAGLVNVLLVSQNESVQDLRLENVQVVLSEGEYVVNINLLHANVLNFFTQALASNKLTVIQVGAVGTEPAQNPIFEEIEIDLAKVAAVIVDISTL